LVKKHIGLKYCISVNKSFWHIDWLVRFESLNPKAMKSKLNFANVADGFVQVVKQAKVAAAFLMILGLLSVQQNLKAEIKTFNVNYSTVEISMWNNSDFVILFDAKTYGNRTQLILNAVAPGKHQVQIYKRLYDKASGKHRMQTVLNEVIYVPASQKVFFQVNRNNKLVQIRSERLPKPQHNYPGQYRPAPVRELPPQHCVMSYETVNIMNAQDFAVLKNMVEDASFSSSQMSIIKQAFSSRMITSAQVLDLMQLFSFESSRLELAKWAYSKTIDKENYFLVNQGFTFSSSIRELESFTAQ
jgi:hypothetical protein